MKCRDKHLSTISSQIELHSFSQSRYTSIVRWKILKFKNRKRTNLMAKDIRVLLYYLYTPIENAGNLLQITWLSVNQSALKAVSWIADEGINGTVSGDYETTQNTWTTFTASQAWKTSGLRLTRKWTSLQEDVRSLQKKLSTLVWKTTTLTTTSTHLETTEFTCLQKSSKKPFLTKYSCPWHT